jgi:quercetin dioxygenase-like cupin family protein
MIVLRNLERKSPATKTARVRNYLVKGSLGSASTTVHENIIGVDGFVPWHTHQVEEILILLEGEGECRTEARTERYCPGDVVIIPAQTLHTLRSTGSVPLRQLCVFPSSNVQTSWKEPESSAAYGLETSNT